MLAENLVLQPWRQSTLITGAHSLDIRQKALLQGHGVADTLTMQQSPYPVAVPGALLEQPLAFARSPLAILVLRRRNPNHAADPRLAAQISQERPHQLCQIDPIG